MSHGAKLPRKSSNPLGSDGSIGSSCFLPDECGHHWGKLNTQNKSPRGKHWKIPKPRIECRSGGDTNFGAQTGRATKVRASKKSQSRWKGTKFHRIAHHRFFDGSKLGVLGVWPFLGWAASFFTTAAASPNAQCCVRQESYTKTVCVEFRCFLGGFHSRSCGMEVGTA